MASDTKRASINKVPIALPKADAAQNANASLVSQDVSLQLAIGSRIRITTAQPNQTTIEGTVYTADPITNLLVLNTSPAAQASAISSSTLGTPAGAYRILPISQISSFQILNLAQSNDLSKPTSVTPNILDTAALNSRLQRSVAAAHAAQAKQGPKGTTGIEQALFDGLSRLYPIRWQGTSIVISDSFIVEKPYDARNVKLLPGAHGDVERVRRVVERQKTNAELRQPITVKAGNGTKASATETPRKGG